MPNYKLCYFEARGLAEMSRLLFAEAGVDYEDVRIAGKDWPKLKPDTPFGHLPVLYVDDEAVGHSRAIVRFLAREFGLDGGNRVTAAQIDAWIETLFEIFQKLPFDEKDPDKQAEKVAIAMKESVGPTFERLEAQIKSKGGAYVMGKEPTAVDFAIATLSQFLEKKFGVSFENYPTLQALFETLAKRPKVAEWISKRPVTEY